jgi:cystinosin
VLGSNYFSLLILILRTSTIAWSLSFYPQPLLNLRRRSTVGTTLSFPIINVMGFIAYFISTIALFSSPLIRAQYAARNPVSPEPTVRGNDVIFVGHSVLMSMTVCSMFFRRIWGFDQDGGRHGKWRVGKLIMGVFAVCVLGVSWMVVLVLIKGGNGGRDPTRWAWLDVVSGSQLLGLTVIVVSRAF